MAFDGTTIASIVHELNNTIKDGRISKIAQPENDELILTVKGTDRQVYRLLISANASLPLIYLTDISKTSPLSAPNFCMLLRKHASGARIINVSQFGLERAICIEIEHLDELGDYCRKYLIIEMMGKHSNIIFCEKNNDGILVIIDSIKRISGLVSSVREVLPGREYFIPNTMDKHDPLSFSDELMDVIIKKPSSVFKAIYTSLTGISSVTAIELCVRAGIDADAPTASLESEDIRKLQSSITAFISDVKNASFKPNIVFNNNTPVEYAVYELTSYNDLKKEYYGSVSKMLSDYYEKKANATRIHQKSYDLRRIVSTALERCRKKLDIQNKQFDSTKNRDKYRVYGELLTTYGYQAEKGDISLVCNNYYTGEDITIPLDKDMTPIENAKRYFERYNKLKRTYEALLIQRKETTEDITHLESISNSLDIAVNDTDLDMIKRELIESGYIKKGATKNKNKKSNMPKSTYMHYISSDGFDIYVGRNNFQNDELTFGNRAPGDWWFHSKGIAGSHVVLKGNGSEVPDRAFEEAGALAAYYSKGRESGKVEIDYTEIQNVKKPKNSKPGFVVYYTNYSLVADTDISSLTLVND